MQNQFGIVSVINASRTAAGFRTIAAVAPFAAASVARIIRIADRVVAVEEWSGFPAHTGLLRIILKGPPTTFSERIAFVFDLWSGSTQ